jgi:hypothetical protein
MAEKEKSKKIDREKQTLIFMIGLYCKKFHNHDRELCEICQDLKEYAIARLEKCPWGDEKPTCSKCTIHCYSPEKREMIRSVMRYSGPRMLLYHPMLLFRHLLK